MNQFKIKLKVIFIPFLIISIATIGVYTFLHWLLVIETNTFAPDDVITNVLVPIIVSALLVLIWLMPRLKILSLKSVGRSSPLANYIIFAVIFIAVPTGIAQEYLITATGKLSKLDYISEIKNSRPTKYYMVRHFYSNKRLVHLWVSFGVSNKGNDYNMTIYAAVPLFDYAFPDTSKISAMINYMDVKALVFLNDTLTTIPVLKKVPADSIRLMRYLNPTFVMPKYGDAGKYGAIIAVTKGYKLKGDLPVMKIPAVAWLALKYNKTISNSLSIAQKKDDFHDFLKECEVEFEKLALNKFIYLDRITYGSDLKEYTSAIISKNDVMGTGTPIVLLPLYEPFDRHNGNMPEWLVASFLIGSLLFLIGLQFKPLSLNADLEKF